MGVCSREGEVGHRANGTPVGYIRRKVKSVIELTELQCLIMRKTTFFGTLRELQYLIRYIWGVF